MGEIATLVLALGPAALLLVVVFYLLANPDKAQRWGEILWSLYAKVRRSGDRRAVRLGVQSRLLEFGRDLERETGRARVETGIEWIDPAQSPEGFFKDGRLVVRLHEHERQDRNIVVASMLLVSNTLVRRAKHLISQTQARAVDLYAVDRLLAKEPHSKDLFHEEHLGPALDKDKSLRDLVASCGVLDRSCLFFPILIRELNHLGHEVTIRPRDERIITDVTRLFGFLETYANRTVGDDLTLLNFEGSVLKCSIVMVAKLQKRLSGATHPYVKRLLTRANGGDRSLYIIGSADSDNAAFVDSIEQDFLTRAPWTRVDRRVIRTPLRRTDGSTVAVDSLLLCLRPTEQVRAA